MGCGQKHVTASLIKGETGFAFVFSLDGYVVISNCSVLSFKYLATIIVRVPNKN